MRNPLRHRKSQSSARQDDDGLFTVVDNDSADPDAEPLTPVQLRQLIDRQQSTLARRIRITRIVVAAWLLAPASAITAGVLTALWLHQPARVAVADTICGVVLAGAAGALVTARRLHLPSRRELAFRVEINQEAQRRINARSVPELEDRRALYREGIADLIEQYRSESRRYRRVHNSLQVLVMTGSAGSTTVAALDWGQQPTWQGITLTGISFAITLASAFTGYYKYRERSYFLQETADAIEEQANALTLGIGEYERFDDDEAGAMAHFTKVVEQKRNEQRRRQQQLDQPADRAEPEGRPQG
jgi:hypothetical protein